MQVKIFHANAAQELEKLINDWLKEHPEIHVEHVTQSEVQHGQQMHIPATVCIWYTEGG